MRGWVWVRGLAVTFKISPTPSAFFDFRLSNGECGVRNMFSAPSLLLPVILLTTYLFTKCVQGQETDSIQGQGTDPIVIKVRFWFWSSHMGRNAHHGVMLSGIQVFLSEQWQPVVSFGILRPCIRYHWRPASQLYQRGHLPKQAAYNSFHVYQSKLILDQWLQQPIAIQAA